MSLPAIPKPAALAARARIRRIAAVEVLLIWCIGIVLGLWFGRSLPQAVSNGAAAALGGAAGWAVYHVVSRRNDGLALMGMSFGPVYSAPDNPFLADVIICLVTMMPIMGICGLVAREMYAGEGPPMPSDLMYDPDVDGSAEPMGLSRTH